MEKSLRKIDCIKGSNKKTIISLLFISLLSYSLIAQPITQLTKIRFAVWAELDAYPGSEEAKKDYGDPSEYGFSVERIKEVAPFLIEGMLYGWEFSYRPYDKTRHVEEEMIIKPIVNPDFISKNINYSSPWIENNRFNCWVQYNKNDYEISEYDKWSSIHNPVIHGKGYGRTENGFMGIYDACKDSLKNAVRTYYRGVIKNKPKEINGKVLIKNTPLIGVDAGRYVINLDFFLECGKIIEYKVF